jgi:hypothetical protein
MEASSARAHALVVSASGKIARMPSPMNFSTCPVVRLDLLDQRLRVVVQKLHELVRADVSEMRVKPTRSLNQMTAWIGSARPRTMLPASTRSAACRRDTW